MGITVHMGSDPEIPSPSSRGPRGLGHCPHQSGLLGWVVLFRSIVRECVMDDSDHTEVEETTLVSLSKLSERASHCNQTVLKLPANGRNIPRA